MGTGCRASRQPIPGPLRAMPGMKGPSLYHVETGNGFEAERVVQQPFPGAITASLSPSMTDQGEVRLLFVDWLGRI